MNDATLIHAYLSAHYLPLGRDDLRLRIGRRARAIELEVESVQQFCLITACNPASVALSDEENARRQNVLKGALERTGTAWMDAIGREPAGTWCEPSLLVLDLPSERFDTLAVELGQNAVLHWQRGQAVRLRLYGAGWKFALQAARVDTRFVESVACATR